MGKEDGFNHSIKVPRLYKETAKISQKVAEGAGSIKQLVYEKTHFNTKALYALVVTTLKKSKELDLLLKRTHLLEKESRLNPWLARVLISELLWGKKQLPKNDAKPILTVLAYEQVFRAHLSDNSVASSSAFTEGQTKPRYVRINTLVNPFNEALNLFEEEGWMLLASKKGQSYTDFLEKVSHLEESCFLRDMHIPDLLVFPCGTEFYNHPGYKKGAIVLQDKASCLPVHILSPPPGSIVLDMCAAPGMKTTQLATVMENTGKIYAVEQNPQRFQTLKKIVEKSGATCVNLINQDVLRLGESDLPKVQYILVDPSCSGSGMTDRLDHSSIKDSFRLQKLAGFQIKILRAALSRYPNAQRIVYSTCSLYPEENEDVVRQVLETNNDFKLVPAGKFLDNQWINFGSSNFGKIGEYCLYARPEEDFSNGFFLAVFERLKDGELNEFYNGKISNYEKQMEQKKAKRDKKRKMNAPETASLDLNENMNTLERIDDITNKKNKKPGKLDTKLIELLEVTPDGLKKTKTNWPTQNLSDHTNIVSVENLQKKKRKRYKSQETLLEVPFEDANVRTNIQDVADVSKIKKKKKQKVEETKVELQTYAEKSGEDIKKSKKKRKRDDHTM
ncbi:28S rRNA (cytosine-C(5))-methyltransferase [Euwallacea fornicatus]|uniref:28S rRNA (cytosine-C(5))-methyltransferase n=1 Tax=Euwallacea fornicatus TaxID=995702 RepID=UPI00338D3DD6